MSCRTEQPEFGCRTFEKLIARHVLNLGVSLYFLLVAPPQPQGVARVWKNFPHTLPQNQLKATKSKKVFRPDKSTKQKNNEVTSTSSPVPSQQASRIWHHPIEIHYSHFITRMMRVAHSMTAIKRSFSRHELHKFYKN